MLCSLNTLKMSLSIWICGLQQHNLCHSQQIASLIGHHEMDIQGGLRQLKICSKKQTNKTPLLSSTSVSLTGENSLMHSMSSSDNTSKRIMAGTNM